MTNANSKQKMTGNLSLATEKISDQAPMIVTRLSGWIGAGDTKIQMPSWIISISATPRR